MCMRTGGLEHFLPRTVFERGVFLLRTATWTFLISILVFACTCSVSAQTVGAAAASSVPRIEGVDLAGDPLYYSSHSSRRNMATYCSKMCSMCLPLLCDGTRSNGSGLAQQWEG